MFIDVSNLKKSYTTGVIKTDVLKGIEMKLGKGNRCHPWAIGFRKIHPNEYHWWR